MRPQFRGTPGHPGDECGTAAEPFPLAGKQVNIKLEKAWPLAENACSDSGSHLGFSFLLGTAVPGWGVASVTWEPCNTEKTHSLGGGHVSTTRHPSVDDPALFPYPIRMGPVLALGWRRRQTSLPVGARALVGGGESPQEPAGQAPRGPGQHGVGDKGGRRA